MLYCLAIPSPVIRPQERRWIDANEVLAAHRGREDGLLLQRVDGAVTLRDWGAEVLAAMEPLAACLDAGGPGDYGAALRAQQTKMTDPNATPSARILAAMRASGEGFAEFARRLTEQHRTEIQTQRLDPVRQADFERLALESLARQAQIEASDDCDFDTFLARYFAQSEAAPVALRSPFERSEEPA
jgi:glutamate--cysteine ligase